MQHSIHTLLRASFWRRPGSDCLLRKRPNQLPRLNQILQNPKGLSHSPNQRACRKAWMCHQEMPLFGHSISTLRPLRSLLLHYTTVNKESVGFKFWLIFFLVPRLSCKSVVDGFQTSNRDPPKFASYQKFSHLVQVPRTTPFPCPITDCNIAAGPFNSLVA